MDVPQKIATPHPPRSGVLARMAGGTGWIIGWRIASRVLGLCSTLILARILVPADFGLVTLAYGLVTAVDAMAMPDAEDAVVRAVAPSPMMYHTAYTMSLLRGLATAIIITLVAEPVGRFFGEPRLAHVLWALALGAVLEGACSAGLIDFRRDLAFGKEFVLQLLPRLLSIAVTVTAALIWRSYWALVIGILAGKVARLAWSFALHPYRPRLGLVAWRDLIGFSSWGWAIGMVGLVRSRIDSFVLGRVIDPTAVGLFSVGEEVATLPTTELVAPLCRAAFSGFVAARDAGESMTDTYLRAVSLAFLVTLPAGVGISLIADPLVRVSVGLQWLDAIPVIQVLGPVGALAVFGYVASVLLSVHALMARQFTVMLGALSLRVALLVPLVEWNGVLGAAVAAAVGFSAEQILLSALAYLRHGLSVREILRRIWRIIGASIAMTGALRAMGLGWGAAESDPLGAIVLATAVGGSVYGASLLALWLICGRPNGAEADFLTLLRRSWVRVTVSR
jgi:O-antigen/teichoic acid export membrane protein